MSVTNTHFSEYVYLCSPHFRLVVIKDFKNFTSARQEGTHLIDS